MEHQGKKQSPYHGVIQTCLLLISVPLILFLIIYLIFDKYQNLPQTTNLYGAMGIGFGVGVLFHISCVIAGLFKGLFAIVVRRFAEFFDNLSISFKFAIKLYYEDLKENGMVFWIYFIIISSYIALSIYGFVSYFTCIN